MPEMVARLVTLPCPSRYPVMLSRVGIKKRRKEKKIKDVM